MEQWSGRQNAERGSAVLIPYESVGVFEAVRFRPGLPLGVVREPD
jgi:hypothetical protein